METIARELQHAAVGRTIVTARVLQPDIMRFVTSDEFVRDIAGARIQAVQRRAKWLLISLDQARTRALHFMLVGRLRLEPHDAKREPNPQLATMLDDATALRLIDRLGYARAARLPNAQLHTRLGLDTPSPEVLAPDFSPGGAGCTSGAQAHRNQADTPRIARGRWHG